MKQWLFCIACLLLASCSHRYGSESLHDIGRYVSLQPGVSTKQDVHQRFGQPGDVRYEGEGSTWFYAHAATQIHGATFVPYVGLFAGGNNIEHTLAAFFFDAADLYQRMQTSRASRYQNMWVGIGEALQHGDDAKSRVHTEMQQLGMDFDEKAWKEGEMARMLQAKPSGKE